MERLAQLMQVHVAVTDPNTGIAVDNMLSQWEGVAYPQLSVVLVHLRFLALMHQTNHWTAKGDPFYGDHLLFERLYNAVTGEIDTVAEKAVGLGSDANVGMLLQTMQLYKLVTCYGVGSSIPTPGELSQKSLQAELVFLNCLNGMYNSMKEAGTLTPGTDNMLQGLYDTHEGHVYFLKQRCGAT